MCLNHCNTHVCLVTFWIVVMGIVTSSHLVYEIVSINIWSLCILLCLILSLFIWICNGHRRWKCWLMKWNEKNGTIYLTLFYTYNGLSRWLWYEVNAWRKCVCIETGLGYNLTWNTETNERDNPPRRPTVYTDTIDLFSIPFSKTFIVYIGFTI